MRIKLHIIWRVLSIFFRFTTRCTRIPMEFAISAMLWTGTNCKSHEKQFSPGKVAEIISRVCAILAAFGYTFSTHTHTHTHTCSTWHSQRWPTQLGAASFLLHSFLRSLILGLPPTKCAPQEFFAGFFASQILRIPPNSPRRFFATHISSLRFSAAKNHAKGTEQTTVSSRTLY